MTEWRAIMELNVDIIKELITHMGESGIDSLNVETGDFKLSLVKNPPAAILQAAPQIQMAASVSTAQANVLQLEEKADGELITSPIVGTFYIAASPENPPFCAVGQHVKKGDTIYIVESMKLMNEIVSENDGVVTEIIVKNAQAVEYGQPIMRIALV
jgi:acetyl-CoA carboxylase biotin carboxyl carrier protein